MKERTFTQGKTILKFLDFKGASCVVPQTLATTVGDKKIVLAGTPYPSNNNKCLGYILSDVDVTDGKAPATYVYDGIIDSSKISSSITITDAAKAATPKVTFYGSEYKLPTE